MNHGWRRSLVYYSASAVVGLVIWQLTVVVFGVPDYLLPKPLVVLEEIVRSWTAGPNLMHQSLVTLLETVVGLLASIAVAIPLAVVMTASKRISDLLYPALVLSQVVPKIAIAPIIVVWMGLGMSSKVVIVFLVAFFVLVVDVSVGLKDVDPDMIQLSRSMQGSTLDTFRYVRIPNALPNFFGGLRVAVTLALVGAIVGELVGSSEGLGYIVLVSLGTFDLPLMFAAIMLMGVMGMLLFGVVEVVEKVSMPWSRASRLEQLVGRGGS